MALYFPEPTMSTLPEFVGTIHIFFGPYRGNPIALYLQKKGESWHISPTSYPWNRFVGIGETVNKAAANFDVKWKEGNLAPEMYSGPHWEGGIKPEKPKPPPKPAAPPKPATTEPAKAETPVADLPTPEATQAGTAKPKATKPSTPTNAPSPTSESSQSQTAHITPAPPSPALPTDTNSVSAAPAPPEPKSSPLPTPTESTSTVDPPKNSS